MESKNKLNPAQKKLLAVIEKHSGRLSIKGAAKAADVPVNTAYHYIAIFKRLGWIGSTRKGNQKFLFSLVPKPKVGLKPIHKKILDIVRQYDGQLSVNGIAEKLGTPQTDITYLIDDMEFRFKVIFTQMIGGERIVFLSPLIEADCRLMQRFNLDMLDFRILEAVKGNESSQELVELAEELKTVVNQIKIRLETSIPTKFEVASFPEAKAIFLKYREEAAVLQVA